MPKPNRIITTSHFGFLNQFVDFVHFEIVEHSDEIEGTFRARFKAGVDADEGVEFAGVAELVHVGAGVFFALDGVVGEEVLFGVVASHIKIV